MKFNTLQVSAHKTGKRVGRGIAAGQGKTAGRGTKGQNSRTGSSKKPGFEGGQNPLMQRLPKLHGFTSHKTRSLVVFTEQLEAFSGKTVDASLLAKEGLIASEYANVKLLKKGDLTKKVTVALQAASATAVEAVEKAGGSFKKTERQARPKTAKEKTERRAKKA